MYPLSGMQQGMLFHCLYEPERGVYGMQSGYEIEGEVEGKGVRRAWEEVVKRHGVLRTSFLWEGLKEPVQVVHREVEVPWREEDWRGRGEEEQEASWREYVEQEQVRGFDLKQAPLLRLGLVRMGERRYRFLWSYHHLVLDGWCQQIVMKEMVELYEGMRKGREIRLGKVRPYREYIEWLQKQDESKAERFWREELKGLSGATRLGMGEEGGGEEEGEWGGKGKNGEIEYRLGEELSGKLEELSRRQRVTQNTIMQGGWGLLLSRYSGEKDVVFGATVSGRSAGVRGIESMVGVFINTLPVRVRVEREERIGSYLQRLQARQVEAREYEHSWLLKVQGWSEVPRGSGIFDHIVVFENYPTNEVLRERLGGGMKVKLMGSFDENNYGLTLAITPGKEILLVCNYSRRQYGEEGVRRLLRHFEVVLESMADGEKEGRRVGEIGLLTEEERRRVVEEYNRSEQEYESKAVHELFEDQVERTPEAVAVEYEGQRWSYGELNRRANQLAHHLRGLGVGAETLVGLCMERSEQLLVGLLGVLKAGAAYVPLDPHYPTPRLAFMVEDAGIALVLSEASLREQFPSHLTATIALDKEWEQIAREDGTNLDLDSSTDNLAYVMYTSGSTGSPKGVCVEHRQICNQLIWSRDALSLTSSDRVLQKFSFSFDASLLESLLPLASGARIVIARPGGECDLDYLIELAVRTRVTYVDMVPSMLEIMLVSPLINTFVSLRIMTIGGEILKPELVRKFYELLPWASLWHTYGPTEATVQSTYGITSLRQDLRRVPIGDPIANTQLYILDSEMELSPIGVTGELYIGGDGVTRGYLNQPSLTADRFVPDRLARQTGKRLYRTGDRARWAINGELEFVGRIDDQLKIRGCRIEPSEIEAQLNECPELCGCAVVMCEDLERGKQLTAYIVPRESRTHGLINRVRSYLVRRLPEYMVPSRYVERKELPLTRNGKVDRKALALAGVEERGSGEYVGPENAEEEIVCGIFAEVLKRERVGREENFFEAGGHSLLATQVVSRVRKVFGQELALRAVFERPTAAGLGEQVRKGRGQEGRQLGPGVVAVERKGGRAPLSYAQQRLWFIEQLEPGSAAYHISLGVRLRGELDERAMERSLGEIVRRHEVLRTRLVMWEGEVVQEAAEEVELKIGREDLSGWEEGKREERMKEVVRGEALERFDLERGPLVRVKVVKMGKQEHVLVVTMHHIISDGWSVEVMMKEFSRLYGAYREGQESPLEELGVQYGDYAIWQREWLQGRVLEEQLEYWRERLQGAAALELPLDRGREVKARRKGAGREFEVGEELVRKLRRVSRRSGATLYMVLLTGFKVLMGRYAGQREVVVGTSIAGRTRAEVEPLIGMFFNMLALRTDLSGEISFAETVERVRETTLGAYAHQEVPFERVVTALGVERDLSYNPLFQVIFELNGKVEEQRLAGLEVEAVGRVQMTAKVDLTMTLNERKEGLLGVVEYDEELMDEGTVERMVGHYVRLLEAMGEDDGQKIWEVEMMREEERKQVVEGWNETKAEYGVECMQDLFEREVEKGKERVAVEQGGRGMSYGEMEERSNQLGHYLRRERGVGVEQRVGLYMERGMGMMVGWMGILKAGGAYVPLDPSYPEERVRYMVKDSGAGVIVTEEKLVAGWMKEEGVGVVCVDGEEGEEIGKEAVSRPERNVGGENLAYIYYTSGSTGRPKGVAMSHRGIANYLAWGVEGYKVREGGGGGGVHSSMGVDLTLTNFLPLCAGGRVELAEEGPGVEGLVELLREKPEWSVLKVTPTHVGMLNGELEEEEKRKSARVMVIGADSLAWETVEEWRRAAPEVEMMNEYGPTETVVGCSIYEMGKGEEDGAGGRGEEKKKRRRRRGPVPIGRPIGNMRMYVLDERYQAVPVGVGGELYIGGVGVARGYWGRPELTAEKFVPDGYGGERGGRLYRSGDRGRYLWDGNLEFLGRVDHQVKVRGFRIELGEIEAVLSGHEGVQRALVVVRGGGEGGEGGRGEGGGGGGKRLVAYVGARGGKVGSGELREYLKERLPGYMVPGVIVVLEELPVRGSGKIDPRDLPVELEAAAGAGMGMGMGGYVEARTEAEREMSRIFAEVLKLERVGVEDNFFELGGHSLLATQVMARVRSRFGLNVPIRILFESPTVAELAEKLEQHKAEHTLEEGVGGQPEIRNLQMEQLLAELEGFSETEAQTLLQTEQWHDE